MEIKGIVTSGQGKGNYFMSKEFYKAQFEEKLNFSPFPGTLNIKIGQKEIEDINEIPENRMKNIEGERNFGGVLLIKATLNDKIDGAIVFPKKTTHGENILEFIAPENLKAKLNIKDGDSVKIAIEY